MLNFVNLVKGNSCEDSLEHNVSMLSCHLKLSPDTSPECRSSIGIIFELEVMKTTVCCAVWWQKYVYLSHLYSRYIKWNITLLQGHVILQRDNKYVGLMRLTQAQIVQNGISEHKVRWANNDLIIVLGAQRILRSCFMQLTTTQIFYSSLCKLRSQRSTQYVQQLKLWPLFLK